MARRSEWYDAAMSSIEGALSWRDEEEIRQLGRQGVRRVCRDYYPFGAMENHPYKMWCRAVNDILDRLFPAKKAETAPGLVRIHPSLGVVCTWCDGKVCLACTESRQTLARLQAEQPDNMELWVRWNDIASGSDEERLVLADWLEDVLDLPQEARHLRTSGTVKVKKKRAKKPRRRAQR